MIPIGQALEASGGTALIAEGIADLSTSPVVVLGLLMIVTMTLSDVTNNTATAVIIAPIALDIAGRLGVNPDPFLMAVAVAASCAFLTPIGHKKWSTCNEPAFEGDTGTSRRSDGSLHASEAVPCLILG